MKVYGLVGPSGSGKSYHAERILSQVGAQFIIDDGLLIRDNQIAGGFSAKFETNQIAAIKRAIFTDEGHRREVQSRLKNSHAKSVLVLGTSQKMVQTICAALGLGQDVEWLDIEERTSTADVALASQLRKRGMHAIPIFQSQLEQAALPLFIRKLKNRLLVQRSEMTVPSRANLTVVSPLFSQGGIYIHPRVVKDSISQLIREGGFPFQLRRVRFNPDEERVLRLHLTAHWEKDLLAHGQQLTKSVHRYLQEKLGLPYMQIDLHIDSIALPFAHAGRGVMERSN